MNKPNISNGEAFCLLLFMDYIHIQYFLISLLKCLWPKLCRTGKSVCLCAAALVQGSDPRLHVT